MVNFRFSERLCLRQTNRPPSTLRALDKPTSVLLNKNKPKTCKVQNARERYPISLTSECMDSHPTPKSINWGDGSVDKLLGILL